MAALVKRFRAPAWALLEQVADGTGYGISRYADAMAMGLWPSRGLDLHGIEVKVSRGDWLRELKRPDKADPLAVYCDFWWLAVAPDVVDMKVDAIPERWGVLVLESRGLVQHREAVRNPSAEDLDRSLVAAILRRASERNVPKESIQGLIDAARDEGFERGRTAPTGEAAAVKELQELRASVAAFQAASGVEITRYNGGDVGARLKVALELERLRAPWVLGQVRNSLHTAVERVDAAIAALAESATSPEGTT